MNIVFRTDSSKRISGGHVVRCLTLAEALKNSGAYCWFISRNLEGNHIDKILQRGFEVEILEHQYRDLTRKVNKKNDLAHCDWLEADLDEDIHQTQLLLDQKKIDWLVVDHYALDITWENALRNRCKKMMVIDDLADRYHNCDLLIDPGPFANYKKKYEKLTPTDCMLLLGPTYAILRPEFEISRINKLSRSPKGVASPLRINIMFSGVDFVKNTIDTLRVVEQACPKDTIVDVIVPYLGELTYLIDNFCKNKKTYNVYYETKNVANLFEVSDLAIGSGGGATYERLYLQLPSILKPVTFNQIGPLTELEKLGSLTLFNSPLELKIALEKYLQNPYKPSKDIVLNGLNQICALILNNLVILKKPNQYDVRRTFRWLENDQLRIQFLMMERPLLGRHFDYWRVMLSSKEVFTYSIYERGKHIGNAGIKNINILDKSAELWLYLSPDTERNKGIGSEVLKQLHEYMKKSIGCSKAVLHVSINNIPALNFYKKFGYKIQDKSGYSTELFNADFGVVRMEKML